MTDPIVAIAARGEGRSASGRFVPMAAPGDWLDANDQLHAGPNRVAPPCRHYGLCGGCQLQHVSDAVYANWLTERVAGALNGQGLAVPPLRAPHLSPPHTRRRATLRGQRTDRAVVIGFAEARSHRIVDMVECPVLDPALTCLLPALRKLLVELLPPRGTASVQMSIADQGVDLLLSGVRVNGLAAHEAMSGFARDHALARLAIDRGEGPETQWEPEPVTVRFGGVAVSLPHGGFLQATRDGEAALVAAVTEAVGPANPIADLFAGLGTFALPLAATAAVTAVEGSRNPVRALDLAARRQQRPVSAEHRDLYRRPLTAAELDRFAAVVLDPPRAGAEEQARMLAQSAVPTIAYVSCNPASFARDCRLLVAGGYGIDWIQPVGQFRWSTHMELAARLSRQ